MMKLLGASSAGRFLGHGEVASQRCLFGQKTKQWLPRKCSHICHVYMSYCYSCLRWICFFSNLGPNVLSLQLSKTLTCPTNCSIFFSSFLLQKLHPPKTPQTQPFPNGLFSTQNHPPKQPTTQKTPPFCLSLQKKLSTVFQTARHWQGI